MPPKPSRRKTVTFSDLKNETESSIENCRKNVHLGIEYCLSGCMCVIFVFGISVVTFAAFNYPATIQTITFAQP